MPEVKKHTPFTPSWFDIGTDVEGAKKFYTALFGWTAEEAGPVEESGGYGFFNKDGQMVAGYGPQQSPGPPYWSTYISVPDADEIAKKVEAAGGQVVVAPMDVFESGRMGVFQDAQGAFISVWQPNQHIGAQVVREPSSFGWVELNTRDVEGSKAFYSSVFGWGSETHAGEMPYTEFKVGGESIAGMMTMPPGVPEQVPPYWLVYVEVDDADAAAAKAKDLGGSVMVPSMDYPGGRFSVLVDPQGAVFAVMQSSGPPSS